MRRFLTAVVLSAIIAISIGMFSRLIAETRKPNARGVVASLTQAGGWLKSRVVPSAKIRVPDLMSLFGRRAKTAFAPPGGGGTSTATVQTDKAAYLPGSHVVASGTGWFPGVAVTLTYTEIATTLKNGTLHAPVQVFASTDSSGNFSSAGNPNADFITDATHDATVTLRVTASGLDATGAQASVQSATFTNGVVVTTDQPHYSVGAQMTILGYGFTPNTAVSVTVQRPDNVVDSIPSPTAAGDGTFTALYQPPFLTGRYRITATDGFYTAKTAVTEADAGTVAAYDQCSNDLGDGYSTGDTGCRWINGNLNANNSTYPEGDATVQQLILQGLDTATHTITFSLGTTKGGKHAYDYFVQDTFSETWATPTELCQGVATAGENDATVAQCANNSVVPVINTAEIPADTLAAGHDIDAANAGRRHFAIRGLASGAPFTIASGPGLASGDYSGDSETTIRLSFPLAVSTCTMPQWKGANNGTPDSCVVVITFGAHISDFDVWGQPTATSISGSPYHVSLVNLDGGSIGQRDNQMQAGAVVSTQSLTLVKVVVNDNGGTKTLSDFPLTAAGPTTISGVSGTTAVTAVLVPAGGYSLSEQTQAGYTASAWACDVGTLSGSSLTLGAGQDATCTITNTDNPPGLHLRKVVVNDNGGTASVSNFTLSANGPTPISGASPVDSGAGFNQGTYTLSETTVAGYTASSWVCAGGTQSGTNISVGLGGSATCTITNNDNPPDLHLRKVVVNDNGGTATVSSFTLSANGPTPISGASPVDSGAGFNQGTYTLSETAVAGYTASAWVCSGGTQSGTNISLGLGGSATCTITNTDNPPALHLRKVLVNDNGGTASVSSFTLSANGPTPISGTSPVDSGAGFNQGTYTLSETTVAGYTASAWSCSGGTQSGTNISVGLGGSATCTITNNDDGPGLHLRKVLVNDNGGTASVSSFTLSANGPTPISGTSPVDSGAGFNQGTYTLSETTVAGYTASAWVCSGGTQSGTSISIGLGGNATCTITNNDNPPDLHLRKVLVNDNGGTASVSSFTLSANGPTPISGTSPVDSGAGFNQGTYTLSETAVTGYTASAWVCSGGTQSGTSISLGLGGSATCTITNNDDGPGLHLRKVLVNDNGGTASVSSFTLSADGPTPISGTSPVDSGAGFNQGTYTLSETTVTGYTASAWVCTGGTQSGTSISIGLGGNATCTITNNDNPPDLHLRKVLVNDNGGTASVSSFTLSANGPTPLSGTSPVDSGAGFNQGTYTLSETAVAGYTASAWVCSGGTQSGSNISLGLGGSATCTITNTDNPPDLHLRKVLVNDNGGTASVSSFTLSANGPTPISGTSPVDSGAGFSQGTYTLSETAVTGYTASAWSCTGGTQSGTNISIGLGGSATCTITNNDNPPGLHLRKVLVNDNGGTASVSSFTLSANGPTPISGTSPVNSGAGFNQGTYTLSETAVTGYTASSWVCSGGTQSGTNISLGLGGSATCTITNNDNPGHARVIKTVSGGTPGATDTFTFQIRTGATSLVAGTTLQTEVANQANNWTINFTNTTPIDLSAGVTYQLCEVQPFPGWSWLIGSPSFTVFNPGADNTTLCTNFTVALGETKVFNVNDTPPPGGAAFTIGYWKNHSSCKSSNGNQQPVLDNTLLLGSITIGTLVLDGTPGTSIPGISDCQAAYNLLNKQFADGATKKAASDPLINLAAQFVGAWLNKLSGAGSSCITQTLADAQALFLKYNFDGVSYSPKLTAADAALANQLATTLDQYNNNLLSCGP